MPSGLSSPPQVQVCFEIQPRIRVQIFKLEGGLFEMMMMMMVLKWGLS
jgi:hypothetical protein